MPKHVTYIFLGAILVVAFGVRVWGIGNKGLLLHDEGDVMLRVRTYVTLSKALPEAMRVWWRGDTSALRAFSHEAFPSGFFPSLSAYPSHIVPGVLLALLFGEHDWTLALWSAILGTLTVLVMYALGKRLSGSSLVGIVAALLLAFSPYHVLYSRLALAHVSAGFFFSLAAFLYIESFYCTERVRYRYLFYSGISLALMASSHYGTFPVLFFFGLAEFCIGIRAFRAQCIGRWGVLLAGVVIPLFAWQVVMSIRADILIRAGYDKSDIRSYIGEVIDMIRHTSSPSDRMHYTWRESSFFFDIMRYAHGRVFMAFFAASSLLIFATLRRRALTLGIFLWLAWAPIVFYSSIHLRVPRTFVIYLPLAFCAAAILINEIAVFFAARRKWLMLALVVSAGIFFTGASIKELAKVIHLRSAYPQAAKKVRELSNTRSVVAMPWPLYQYYGGIRVESYSLVADAIRPAIYVTDWTSVGHPWELALQRGRKPFLEIPVPAVPHYFFLLDTFPDIPRKTLRRTSEENGPLLKTVRFYDLAM